MGGEREDAAGWGGGAGWEGGGASERRVDVGHRQLERVYKYTRTRLRATEVGGEKKTDRQTVSTASKAKAGQKDQRKRAALMRRGQSPSNLTFRAEGAEGQS